MSRYFVLLALVLVIVACAMAADPGKSLQAEEAGKQIQAEEMGDNPSARVKRWPWGYGMGYGYGMYRPWGMGMGYGMGWPMYGMWGR